jgi:F0F1-type ATP synthase assembly protein I
MKIEDPGSRTKQLFVMAIAASQMGFLVAAGLLGGLWLDRKWGTSPWLGMLGLVAGFGAGIRFLVQLVRMSNRSTEVEIEKK